MVSAALGAVGTLIGPLVPWPACLLESVNFLLSLGVIAVLLAMIFRYLPDAAIAWSDVWMGAVVASLLLTSGKALIGLYLARSTVASAYGPLHPLSLFSLGFITLHKLFCLAPSLRMFTPTNTLRRCRFLTWWRCRPALPLQEGL